MKWSLNADPTDGESQDGEFWLSSNPERRIPGRLRLSRRHGPWIVLRGSLEAQARNDYPTYSEVRGQLSSQPVVLFDATQISEPAFSQHEQIVTADHCVIGWSDEPITNEFRAAVVGFSALDEWLGFHPIRYDPPHEVDVGEVSARVEFVQPDRPGAVLTEGTRLAIHTGPGLTSSRFTATVRLSPVLEVTQLVRSAAESHYTIVRRFRDFVAFCTEYPVQVLEAHLLYEPYRPEGPNSGPPLEWWARWNEPGSAADDPASWTHMSFVVRDQLERWPQMVTTWFERWDEMRDSAELLLSLTFAPPTYWDTRLLLVTSAAEAYHRAVIANERWPKAEFRSRRRSVLESIPADERQWVDEATRYANEPTLRSRLTDLHAKTQAALPLLFERYPEWAKTTSQMRNRYAHRGKAAREKFLPDDIFVAVEVTSRVVRACILLDLGLPATDLASGLMRRPDYLRLVHQ